MRAAEDPGGGKAEAHRLSELEERRRRREVTKTSVTVAISWCILLAAYFAVSPDAHIVWTALVVIVGGGFLFAALLVRQLHGIVAAELPELRAVQAIGVTIIVFLLLFATAYLAFPGEAFSRPLNHASALYFTITVFATVGFGDITPETDAARLFVSAQMILDIVLIGAIVKAFVSAAQARLAHRGSPSP